MKNIIEYFYKIEIESLKYVENKYYLSVGNDTFLFEECSDNLSVDVLLETQRYDKFHRIIFNINGSIITNYEGINYILFKIVLIHNRIITLDDIKEVSLLTVKKNFKNVDCDFLWSRKVDSFERFINNKDSLFKFREYYDYFIGLSENAIQYYRFFKAIDIKYGFTYNRIAYNTTLFDLYNPLNIVISPVVRGVAEYFKSMFFYSDALESDCIDLFDLTFNEAILFYSRMLFPTYFFDLYKDKRVEDGDSFRKIINILPAYEKYLSSLHFCIKKRHKNMPNIKWILTSQL